MKQFKKPTREEGFTLVELIVVTIIMAILCQIGLVSLNRYSHRTRAFAARTALRNIKSECEMNRDLGMDPVFTLLKPSSYSIETSNTNSCLGRSDNNLVVAKPDNEEEYPFYYYDFSQGKLGCEINSQNIVSLASPSPSFEGNETTLELSGWWGRNDRATVTINGQSFTAGVYDSTMGVRNDDLDEYPANNNKNGEKRWYGKFWEQISDQINKANLTDQEGEKISASVDYNQLKIQSKSQSNLEVKATAYNDQGGYNTQPRFTKNERILPPKAHCSSGYNF